MFLMFLTDQNQYRLCSVCLNETVHRQLHCFLILETSTAGALFLSFMRESPADLMP